MAKAGWRGLAPAGAALALAALLLVIAPWAPAVEATGDGSGDAALYAGIVDLMRGGEGYYRAAHAMLLSEGYGTLSVFNWRLPTWPSLLAALPAGGAQVLLGAVAVLVLLLSYRLWRQEGELVPAMIALLLLAPSLGGVLVPQGVVFSEVAAGLLLLLTVVLQASGWRAVAVVSALLALFLRELALPFVLLAGGLALLEGRRREAIAWGVGIAAFLGFFAWHWTMVAAQLGPLDRAYPEGWMQFGGLGFLLAAVGFNGLWSLLPGAAAAVLLPLGLYGLWRWTDGRLALLAMGGYCLGFLVFGKPFNAYWGAMITPLMMLGAGWAIVVVARRDR